MSGFRTCTILSFSALSSRSFTMMDEKRMTGISAVPGSARRSDTSVRPSITGISMSEIRRSKFSCFSIRRSWASAPSLTG